MINTLVLAITIFINYVSNTGVINGKTIGEVSGKYSTLVTPAGYAFSIWGLIYLALGALVVYQWIQASRSNPAEESLKRVGYKLALVNILNCLWVLLWLYGMLTLSVLVMIGILISLTLLTVYIAQGKQSNAAENWFVKFPIYIYQGWIIVALVANTSASLVSSSFDFLFSDSIWAVLVIALAFGIYIFQTYQLKQSVSMLVGVWGISAIGVKQLDVAYVGTIALVVSGILLAHVLIFTIRKKSIF